MRWLKRDRWKAGIAIAGMLLFLVLMVWVPVPAAGAYERALELATPVTGTVQATPTEDATVTALNKEKLAQEGAQQPHTWENWLWSNGATILSSFFSTLVIVIGALIVFWRWRGDQRTEQEKRAEERFQSAATGLGDEKEGQKIGAAIVLRTFLHPGYEQFYTQTFDLAVANLRLRRTSLPSEDPDGIPHSPEDPNTPLPLTTLSQALIMVFKEAFPLARSQNKKSPESLDASRVQLDNAFLVGVDLKQVWLPEASLRNTNLNEANLNEADLSWAKLSRAKLSRAKLSRADLSRADLSAANLSEAKLSRAKLSWANLNEADLSWADLSRADLSRANLSAANLNEAKLSRAKLSGADLREVRNLEYTQSLKDTILRGVTGLTKEQLEACKAKGAIIDEDATPSPPQSPVSPSAPSQSNDTQAPSAPPAQGSTPTPNTDESSTTSSQSGTES